MTLQIGAQDGPIGRQDVTLLRVEDLRPYREGGWALKRAITEERWKQRGTLEGHAAFMPEHDGLLYRETGRMQLDNYDGRATRAYRFAFPEPYLAQVSFMDGRHFHDLDLRSGEAEAVHLCGRDRYEGCFQVIGPDHWRVFWRVEGPHKALQIQSCYRRR